MNNYSSCYDPPLVADIEADREEALATSNAVYLHLGFFMYWYSTTEMSITALLKDFSAPGLHATQFQLLTRGMDAKTKSERLKEAVEKAGWLIDPPLQRRFDHFIRRLSALRNKLVHNYLYWKDDALQITNVAHPPHDPHDPIPGAPKPEILPSLELFERGRWLCMFTNDLWSIVNSLPEALPKSGTLQRDHYWSSLPTGDRPSPQKQAQRASADKRSQTESGST